MAFRSGRAKVVHDSRSVHWHERSYRGCCRRGVLNGYLGLGRDRDARRRGQRPARRESIELQRQKGSGDTGQWFLSRSPPALGRPALQMRYPLAVLIGQGLTDLHWRQTHEARFLLARLLKMRRPVGAASCISAVRIANMPSKSRPAQMGAVPVPQMLHLISDFKPVTSWCDGSRMAWTDAPFAGRQQSDPMRYRLRTLLIVVTLLCGLAARVAYLRYHADFHKREVARLVSQIAKTENEPRQNIEYAALRLAEFGLASDGQPQYVQRELFINENGASSRVSQSEWENNLRDWHSATYHQILADRYSRAVYRPWTFVTDGPIRR